MVSRSVLLAVAAAALSLACEPMAPRDEPLFDLVFEGRLGGPGATPELLTLDPSTTGGRRVLAAGRIVMDPEPSPDGWLIAFVVADYTQSTGDIYVMDRTGNNVVQLTTDPELDDQPSWSPDGSRIVFRSFREGRDGDIYVMNADGSNQVNIYPDPLPAIIDLTRPTWSSVGNRIAFASNESGTYDIWTMRPDGTDRVQVTSGPDLDTEPAWLPESAVRLAFRRTSVATNSSDIHFVDAASGPATPVALALPGEQRLPRYLPDGTQIIFVSHETITSRPDLYIAALDGSHFRPLVTSAVPGGSLHPAFLIRRQ